MTSVRAVLRAAAPLLRVAVASSSSSSSSSAHLPLLLMAGLLSGGTLAFASSKYAKDLPTPPDLRPYIDYTILKPEATPKDIVKVVEEAVSHKLCAVCVNPVYVKLAKQLIKKKVEGGGHPVKVCTVIGFPLGAAGAKAKELETTLALEDGADEIDVVISVGKLKAGLHAEVKDELVRVTRLCRRAGATSKVIIETCLLTHEEKVTACRIAMEAGADYVKTSTGFSSGGANEDDIRLMSRVVGPYKGKVKASGGVRTKEAAEAMIRAGASRIGTSSLVCSGSSSSSTPSTARGAY